MVNNWVMQREPKKPELPVKFDDVPKGYKFEVKIDASIGDYISAKTTKQEGVVIGIIKNKHGDNVCYKVLYREFERDKYDKIVLNRRTKKPKVLYECFDYIPIPLVTDCSKCTSTDEKLSELGYEWIDGDPKDKNDNGHYLCKSREDVIFC